MFGFLNRVGQTILLVAGVLSVVYAVRPDLRRWVETELVARHSYYYVGMFELRPNLDPGDGERIKFIQFYSNRWEIDRMIFDERIREDDEDAFDVFASLPGEVLISSPVESYGPLPGRSAPEPTAPIESLALSNQCFRVDDYMCRYPLGDERNPFAWRTDPQCRETMETVRSEPAAKHSVALWVKAVRFTCTGL